MSVRVLVRCFGDEPVIMYAEDHGVMTLMLSRLDPPSQNPWIPWSRDNVFRADMKLFAEMKAAFNTFDTATLNDLWKDARHYPAALPSEEAPGE